MRTSARLATIGAAATLSLTPAAALASTGHGKPTSRGATPATTRHAYGTFCQHESKTHVKGEQGTAFSRCVTDLAKLDSDKTRNPHIACKNESKTHVKGERGTAFSRCVVAANRLLQSERKKKA